jgi:N-acetylglucosamine kinase-like BadF-type ATPase
MLLKTLQIPDLDTLAYRIIDGEFTSEQVSLLAPLVLEASTQGDKVAHAILVHQAEEIATSAFAMLRRLDMLNIEVDIVLSGGVFQGNSARLIEMATDLITQKCPKATICRLDVPPVTGAVFLAFDAIGISIPSIRFDNRMG